MTGISPNETAPDDDQALLARIAQGDEAAMRTAYGRYSQATFAAARRVLRSTPDAEDVTIETFELLWRKARKHKITLHKDSLVAWLIAAANFTALNYRRTVLKRRKHEDPAEELEHEQAGDSGFRDIDLIRAVASLDPVDRQIVELCLSAGTSYKEAARQLGLTHATVRNRLSRARSHLRTILTPIEEGGRNGFGT